MKYATLKEVKRLVDQIMALTEWRAAEIMADDKAKMPCGLLIGDEDFFKLLDAGNDE